MSDVTLDRPIFIVGPGRSGTTLLRSLLSAHSRIAVTPETHFLKRAYLSDRKMRAPEDFDAFWQAYIGSTRFLDLGIDADECRRRILSAGDTSFRTIFSAVLASYADQSGKPRVGEKTPGHSAFLSVIFAWYPDARVIAIRRDPRAVVASQLKTPWVNEAMTASADGLSVLGGTRAEMVAYYARDWRHVYETQVAAWQGDPRLTLLAYEDLTRDPEGEMRRICEFLGEEFEPAMVEQKKEEQAPEPTTPVDAQWADWRREHHAKSRGRVTTESLEKWRSSLSDAEIAMIEGHCGRIMKRAGYPRASNAAMRTGGRLAVKALSTIVRAEKALLWRAAPWRRPPLFSPSLGNAPVTIAPGQGGNPSD